MDQTSKIIAWQALFTTLTLKMTSTQIVETSVTVIEFLSFPFNGPQIPKNIWQIHLNTYGILNRPKYNFSISNLIDLKSYTTCSNTMANVTGRVSEFKVLESQKVSKKVYDSHQQQFFSELPLPGRSHYTNYYLVVNLIKYIRKVASQLTITFITTVAKKFGNNDTR